MRSEAAAIETRTQMRFLVDATKPTPEFFNTLKVEAMRAVQDAGLQFHHINEDRLGDAWAIGFFADDRSLRYFYLFTAEDLGELILAPALRTRLKAMLTKPIGAGDWDKRTADRLYATLSRWLEKKYSAPMSGHVAMTSTDPKRITEVTLHHPAYPAVGTILSPESMVALQGLAAAEMHARFIAICGQFLDADHSRGTQGVDPETASEGAEDP